MVTMSLQQLGQDDQRNRGQHEAGGESIDLGRNPSFYHGVDVQGQGGGIRACHEEADDKVVNRKRKSHEGTGYDAGQDHGECHVPEGLPGCGVQIAGGFFQILAAAFQPGTYSDDDEGQAESDMGDDQGGLAQGNTGLGKQHQQGQAHDDFRNQDGQVQQAVDEALAFVLIAVQGQGAERAHDRGYHRRNGSYNQAVGQGFQDPVVIQQRYVPLQGKARPYRIDPGFIEGIQGQDQQGQVQECQNSQGIG